MLRYIFIFIVLVFIVNGSHAQNFQWARQIGNANSGSANEECTVVQTDTLGNLYVIGDFVGSVDLDPLASHYFLYAATSTISNSFFAKYTTDGKVIWGYNLDVNILSGEVANDGSFYLFGALYHDTDFDPSNGVTTAYTSAGSNFVAKYTTNGDFVWVKNIADYPYATAIDKVDGTLYAGQNIITKIDANGNNTVIYDFTNTSTVPGYILCQAMTVDKNRNLIITGTYNGKMDFDFSPSTFYITKSGTYEDPFVASYALNGQLNWAIGLDGDMEEWAGNVETDDNGDVYIVGFMNSTKMDFDPTANVSLQTTTIAQSSYFAKYTSAGALVWGYILPSTDMTALALDSKKNVLIHGSYVSENDFDPSASGTYISSIPGGFLASFNGNSGNFQWFELIANPGTQNTYGSAHGQSFPSNALVTDKKNNAFLASWFIFVSGVGMSDFDPSPAVYPLYCSYPANIYDGFISKYAPYNLAIATDKNIYCQGEIILMNVTASGYFPNTNLFKIEISDASGSFATALTLATFTGSATGLATYTIPSNITPSNSYLVRFSSSYPSYAPIAVYPISIRSGALALSSISGSVGACFNDNGRVYSIASLSGYSYQWSSPANSTILGTNTSSVVNLKFQSYATPSILKVRQTNAQGCFADVQSTINPFPLPVTPAIEGPSTICGNALNVGYSVSGGSLSSYTWSSTTAGIYLNGTLSSTSVNFYITAPGSISVVETDNNGCVGAPVWLKIYPLPFPNGSVLNGQNSVCRNATNVVYQVASVNGIHYSWSLPSYSSLVGTNTLNTLTVNFSNYITPGVLRVNHVNSDGCFVTNALTIGTLPSPITSPISGPTSICGNAQNISYSITPNTLSSTNWNVAIPSTITSSTSGSILINVNNFLTNGIITSAETNQFGCEGNPSVLTITAFAVPITPPISGPASICGNAQNIRYSVAEPSASTYMWTSTSPGITVLGNGTSASLNFNISTASNLSVQETSINGCIGNPVQTNLTPYSLPTLSTIFGFSNVCPNQSNVIYQISSTLGMTYAWSIPNGAAILGSNTLSTLTVSFTNFTTSGVIAVSQTNSNNCTIWSYINVSPNPFPISSLVSGPTTICGNAQGATYSINSNPNSTTRWAVSFPSVVVSNSPSQLKINASNFTVPGFISATETNQYGCIGNPSILSIFPLDVPITPVINGTASICGNAQNVPYFINGQSSSSYNWYSSTSGISITSSGTSAVLNFDLTSTGTLFVQETSANGCIGNPVSLALSAFVVPSPLVIGGPTNVCPKQSNVVYQVAPVSGINYQWTTPSTSTILGSALSNTITVSFVNFTNTGILSVKQTTANNCSIQNNLVINANPVPMSSSITGPTSICGNALGINYSFNPNPNSTVNWKVNFPNSINSINANSIQLNAVNFTAPGFITVTETNALGCEGSPSSLLITPYEVPQTPAILGPSSVCGNDLNVIYSVAGSNSSTYSWFSYFGGITISGTGTTSSLNFSLPVSSQIQLFVQETSQYGCLGNPVSTNILVNPAPYPVGIAGNPSICSGKMNELYYINPRNGVNYSWLVPENLTVSGLNSLNTLTVSFPSFTTTGTIVSVQAFPTGCNVKEYLDYTILPTITTSSITGPTSICGNNLGILSYSILQNPNSTINWNLDFPYTPIYPIGSTIKFAIGNMTSSGIVSVSETNQYGCTSKPSIITLTPLPFPKTLPTITGPSSVCANSQNFTYSVLGANLSSTYSWIPPRFGIGNVLGTSSSSSINLNFDLLLPLPSDNIFVKEVNSFGCVGNYSSMALTYSNTPSKTSITNVPYICSTASSTLISVLGNTNYSYQWTIPSNAYLLGSTNTANWINLKFNDLQGGLLSLNQTDNYTGCQSLQTITLVGIPDPTITGPSYICPNSSVSSTFTLSNFSLSGANYTWSAQATLKRVNVNPNQATYTNFTSPYVSLFINAPGCYKSISQIFQFPSSPNPPILFGPDYVCTGSKIVQYRLSNTNKGYRYNWFADNIFLNSTKVNDSTFIVDVTNLVANNSAGKISVEEQNIATGCKENILSKSVVAYPFSVNVVGHSEICDTSLTYKYALDYSNPTISYAWNIPPSLKIINGQTSSVVGLQMKGNTSAADISAKITNELGCVFNSSSFQLKKVSNRYLLQSTSFTCADSLLSLTLNCVSGFDTGLNKLTFCLTFNPALVSIPITSVPYTSKLFGNNNSGIVFQELAKGKIQVTINRNIYLNNYPELVKLYFAPNLQVLNVGDKVDFATCSIEETYNDGFIQNCFSATSSSTMLGIHSSLIGNIVINYNSHDITLGYDPSFPAKYNPTYVYGSQSTLCSSFSPAQLPDINGSFSYDISNGNYIHIERQIPSTTNVINYINAADGKRLNDIISVGVSPFNAPGLAELLAADVNMDGKVNYDDYQMIMNRPSRASFNQVDGRKKSWSFIDNDLFSYYQTNNNISFDFDPLSYRILLDQWSTLPKINDCQEIVIKSNKGCTDIPITKFRGILLGDLTTDTNKVTGHFDNAPYSGLRTASDSAKSAQIIVDLTKTTPIVGGKVQFPIYVNAADSANALDMYWNYDTTMIAIDSISSVDYNLNSNFKYVWNKIGSSTLQVSGFSPGQAHIYSNVEVLLVTASLSGFRNPFTNTNLTLINGKRANGLVRIGSVTEEMEALYSTKPFIYPNPGDGSVKIGGIKGAVSTSISVHVFNTLGVEVYYSDRVYDSIDLAHVANGVYYLKIRIGLNEHTLPYTKL